MKASSASSAAGNARAQMRALPLACLLAMVAATASATGAESFDWRMRGILFRVTAPVHQVLPLPAPREQSDGAHEDAGQDAAVAAVAADNAVDGVQPDIPPPAADDVDPLATEAPLPDSNLEDAAEPLVPLPPPAPPPSSFVFATIHYGDMDALLLYLPRLRQHLQESSVLVNEVDLSAAWRPEYESYRQLPAGQTLDTLIGEQAFAELQALLPESDPAALQAMKPWVAMSVLEFPPGHQDKSIDSHLQEWAQEAGLERVHLENLPDQLAALDCVRPTDYAPVLRQRLLGGWSFDLDAERTVGYYRERDLAAWLDDIEAMRGLGGPAVAAEEEARRCLISVRNARWLPVLEQRLQQGGAFVAVGAIHLTGAEGLLMQLAARGFQVSVEPW